MLPVLLVAYLALQQPQKVQQHDASHPTPGHQQVALGGAAIHFGYFWGPSKGPVKQYMEAEIFGIVSTGAPVRSPLPVRLF